MTLGLLLAIGGVALAVLIPLAAHFQIRENEIESYLLYGIGPPPAWLERKEQRRRRKAGKIKIEDLVGTQRGAR